MRKIFVLALLLCVGLAGCGSSPQAAVILPQNGVAEGGIGDTMRARSMDFTVVQMNTADSYAGVPALRGEHFIDLEVLISNTSAEALTLAETDFQLLWGSEGFADTMLAMDETMAPSQFEVAAGGQTSWHFVYSVSSAVTHFSFCYVDDTGQQNAGADIFYVKFVR